MHLVGDPMVNSHMYDKGRHLRLVLNPHQVMYFKGMRARSQLTCPIEVLPNDIDY